MILGGRRGGQYIYYSQKRAAYGYIISLVCAVIDQLQEEMGRGNITAITTMMEAQYSAGKVLEVSSVRYDAWHSVQDREIDASQWAYIRVICAFVLCPA